MRPPQEAPQRDVDGAQLSPNGGALEQLRGLFLLAFILVPAGPRLDRALRTGDMRKETGADSGVFTSTSGRSSKYWKTCVRGHRDSNCNLMAGNMNRNRSKMYLAFRSLLVTPARRRVLLWVQTASVFPVPYLWPLYLLLHDLQLKASMAEPLQAVQIMNDVRPRFPQIHLLRPCDL